MRRCFRCEKDENQVKLIDAVYENEIVDICERCAIIENIPVIRKPTISQLRESERSVGVYQRLRSLAGFKEPENATTVLDELQKLDSHPEREEPEKPRPFNLVENFHWQVKRARRNKGLSHKQLGWALGESEMAVKLIEEKQLPEDAEKLIRKLEQFFQIQLRERTLEELNEERLKREQRLKESSKLPEEEARPDEPVQPMIEEQEVGEDDLVSSLSSGKAVEIDHGVIEGDLLETSEDREIDPSRVLTFKPEVLDDITISDLQRIKEEGERQDRLSEVEAERKKALEAQNLLDSPEIEEGISKELKAEIVNEMKQVALGKEKTETLGEKREMLNKAISGLEKEKAPEAVPSIHELVEKRKQKEVEAVEEEEMVGNEIELVESAEELVKGAVEGRDSEKPGIEKETSAQDLLNQEDKV